MAEREQRRDRRDREDASPEFADRLVAINRVSKTVKGGKRFGFAALVVVGDQKGRVGYGKGKAKEVPEAIRKATEQAKRSMIRVPLREGRTLHHDIEGRHGAGRVVMRTAVPGTGIIAGGPMRAVFEMLGLQDIVSKSLGSNNPYNMIRATIDGLADGLGHFLGLALAVPDTTLLVAHDHESGKAEALAPLHGLGHPVDRDEAIGELGGRIRYRGEFIFRKEGKKK